MATVQNGMNGTTKTPEESKPVDQPAHAVAPSRLRDIPRDGSIHHMIVSQALAVRQGGEVLVRSERAGNLRAYGELVPGTVVVVTEDRNLPMELAVPLDQRLTPVLLPGFTTRNLVRRAWAYRKARTALRELVARSRFVQIQHPGVIGFLAGRAAVELRKTFYLDIGGSLRDPAGATTPRPLRNRIARIYYYRAERRLADAASLLIAVNAHLHNTLPPSQAPKVVVSHSMIRERDIHLRDDACRDPGRITLFVATRMTESKGIHHLIGAVGGLRERNLPVHLNIAGVGEFLPNLRRLTNKLGLERYVSFLGGLPAGEQLWSHYRKADIVVLPSLGHYEGTPRMIIEAWAAGAPVVATTVGGIPSLVQTEEDGLLVPPGNETAIADAVRRIVQDGPLRGRLMQNGYKRARAMTYEGRLLLLRRAFEEHLPGLLPAQP